MFNVKKFLFFYLEPTFFIDSLELFKYSWCWVIFSVCYGRFIFWLILYFYFCFSTFLDFLSIFRIDDVHEAREDHLMFFEFFLYVLKYYGAIFLWYYIFFIFFSYFIFPFLFSEGFEIFGGFIFFLEYFVFPKNFL
jgi:hypothetical protein